METNLIVTGQAADGTRHALPVLRISSEAPGTRTFSALVQLPDMKADPQQVAELKLHINGLDQMVVALTDQVRSWEKRFDALLAVKGGAA